VSVKAYRNPRGSGVPIDQAQRPALQKHLDESQAQQPLPVKADNICSR
jgi:hypothetical protein